MGPAEWGVVAVCALLAAALIGPTLRFAPFLPTPRRDVRRGLALSGLTEGEIVIDLGCGDGRVLVTAARRFGARGRGVEISWPVYLLACLRVRLADVGDVVRVRRGDLYRADVSMADVVFLYGARDTMGGRLARKLASETRPGTRVVSYRSPVPGWTPTAVSRPPGGGGSPLYLYHPPCSK